MLALVVGVAGGIYGISGGSLLGPILVGRGIPVTTVAPAALASTFATSLVGAGTYALPSLVTTGDIAPDWPLGLACGLGGLAGGYLGARLQPRLPERVLRLRVRGLSVFDQLATTGRDLWGRPLRERLEHLGELLAAAGAPLLQPVLATTSRDEALAWSDELRPLGVEGVVSKSLRGRYAPPRTRWLKTHHQLRRPIRGSADRQQLGV